MERGTTSSPSTRLTEEARDQLTHVEHRTHRSAPAPDQGGSHRTRSLLPPPPSRCTIQDGLPIPAQPRRPCPRKGPREAKGAYSRIRLLRAFETLRASSL